MPSLQGSVRVIGTLTDLAAYACLQTHMTKTTYMNLVTFWKVDLELGIIYYSNTKDKTAISTS